ncbi:cell wall hydrolase [Magnetospirillum sulfuroxidans]|uniref:Cell wall hydrolase n=1 Tax=Magnetospirillum sulfuroxidans TaxID=611300 RepID=A0ABS5IAR5_9PROT|nr:cell wall hydrolase [Magnetospirillum sulfuroxidans]MBR9970803.1 cell wall hydrolase [Magnetospirillum sulfuroxidans]
MSQPSYTDRDLDILTRTLVGEAEVKDSDDAQAIANVIVNRMRLPNWPDSAAEVCLQPHQFSCWNNADPQRARILAMDKSNPWFLSCLGIARQALDGALADQTHRATHYWATYIKEPKWAKGKTPCYSNTAGRYVHHFYNDIDTPPPVSAGEALDQVRPLAQTRTVQGAQVALGGGAIVATAMEAANQVRDVLPILDTIRQYSPWLVLAAMAIGIGIMVWARIDDRAQGLR